MSDRQKQVQRILRENQFELAHSTGGHLVYISLYPEPVVLAATPSDWRAVENAYQNIRRIVSDRKADASGHNPMPSVLLHERAETIIRKMPALRRGKSSKGRYVRKTVRELTPEEKEQSRLAAEAARQQEEAARRYREAKRVRAQDEARFVQSLVDFIAAETQTCWYSASDADTEVPRRNGIDLNKPEDRQAAQESMELFWEEVMVPSFIRAGRVYAQGLLKHRLLTKDNVKSAIVTAASEMVVIDAEDAAKEALQDLMQLVGGLAPLDGYRSREEGRAMTAGKPAELALLATKNVASECGAEELHESTSTKRHKVYRPPA